MLLLFARTGLPILCNIFLYTCLTAGRQRGSSTRITMAPDQKVPVSVVTGFLGAGKLALAAAV